MPFLPGWPGMTGWTAPHRHGTPARIPTPAEKTVDVAWLRANRWAPIAERVADDLTGSVDAIEELPHPELQQTARPGPGSSSGRRASKGTGDPHRARLAGRCGGTGTQSLRRRPRRGGGGGRRCRRSMSSPLRSMPCCAIPAGWRPWPRPGGPPPPPRSTGTATWPGSPPPSVRSRPVPPTAATAGRAASAAMSTPPWRCSGRKARAPVGRGGPRGVRRMVAGPRRGAGSPCRGAGDPERRTQRSRRRAAAPRRPARLRDRFPSGETSRLDREIAYRDGLIAAQRSGSSD